MNNLRNNRIFLTGGAGFIGTHLAERLYKENEVILFDNLRRDSLSELMELKQHPNVKFIEGDVLNKDQVLESMKQCNIVLHLAAIAGVSSYYTEPAKTLKVNLMGTMNVLECCKEVNIEKVVDFSTSEVYGSDAFDVKEKDNHCIGPVNDFRWTYALSKLASEQLTLRFAESYGFKAFTVRPFNIYGPRQTGEGAISNFLRAVVKNEPIVVYGDGTPIRSWCYVDDCVDAVVRLLESNTLENGTFNIGNPKETYSTLGLARLVKHVVQKDIQIMFKKLDRTEIRVRVPNINMAKKLLDYEPKVDLFKGLQLTYDWFVKKDMK